MPYHRNNDDLQKLMRSFAGTFQKQIVLKRFKNDKTRANKLTGDISWAILAKKTASHSQILKERHRYHSMRPAAPVQIFWKGKSKNQMSPSTALGEVYIEII